MPRHTFATPGGSGIGKTAEKLQPYVNGGKIAGAKLVHSASEDIKEKSKNEDRSTGLAKCFLVSYLDEIR